MERKGGRGERGLRGRERERERDGGREGEREGEREGGERMYVCACVCMGLSVTCMFVLEGGMTVCTVIPPSNTNMCVRESERESERVRERESERERASERDSFVCLCMCMRVSE
jgi:hypothetical protein